MKKFLYLITFLFLLVSAISAREGMWIPLLLDKYNIDEMQKMGFKLSAEDIYDINNASMKDAVVLFGSGCTGGLISENGLLITNHHCGDQYIQSHSSVENNYLENGFWAMSREEELPNPGLKVSFLEYMKNVTGEVLEGTEGLLPDEYEKKIRENSDRIEKESAENGTYETRIKPLYYGNQYYLYVYKIYHDVRLVGAPPSAIGDFGGDTDNWMWPRHTGDFSMFRIYAGENNEPADYSPDNVPFKPKKFFKISLGGIRENDFTMVLGNPGSTQQYIPSHEVGIIMNQRDPERIKLRDIKLDIIRAAMETDPKTRIRYTAKYASMSNAWKKWQGEIKGLQRLDAVVRKKAFENEFQQWAKNTGVWEDQYKAVFSSFEELYDLYDDYIHLADYYSEVITRGVEIFKVASRVNSLINEIENKQADRISRNREFLLKYLPGFFKNYEATVDEALFVELIPMLVAAIDINLLPEEFKKLNQKNDDEKSLEKIYRKSVLTDQEKLKDLLNHGNEKQLLKLRKDPLFSIYKNLNFHYEVHIKPILDAVNFAIGKNMKIYMAGIMEMKSDEILYPDANLTFRVSYGKVEGYEPSDGIRYSYYTTLSGLMEKEKQAVYDDVVPGKLKELFYTKDYGNYGSSGELQVCFTASNHTTGGNSGSPVINATGELVGVNFDRCWEGTMSDIMYDSEMCRNIVLDIRYALFIVDKFAGAGYLIDEMEIAK